MKKFPRHLSVRRGDKTRLFKAPHMAPTASFSCHTRSRYFRQGEGRKNKTTGKPIRSKDPNVSCCHVKKISFHQLHAVRCRQVQTGYKINAKHLILVKEYRTNWELKLN